MTVRKSKSKAADPAAPGGKVRAGPTVAGKLNSPFNRHGLTAMHFQGQMASGLPEADRPHMGDFADNYQERCTKMGDGDLGLAGRLLASQALTLDAIFTEMARRSGTNMGEYLNASERYMRLALKAQANSRAALEALAKLHQPREQTVRHVHINEGGQAVIADQFHNHTGGKENAKSNEQPHEQGALGPALPSPDPLGQPLPMSGDSGGEAMPLTRRQRKRSA
jgi:hypothetical protein